MIRMSLAPRPIELINVDGNLRTCLHVEMRPQETWDGGWESASTHARHSDQPRPRHCCHAFSLTDKLSEKLTTFRAKQRHKQSGIGNFPISQTNTSFPKNHETRTDRQINKLCVHDMSALLPSRTATGPGCPVLGARVKDKQFNEIKLHYPLPPPTHFMRTALAHAYHCSLCMPHVRTGRLAV